MRYDLSGKSTALEEKSRGRGVISWTTRGQFGLSGGMQATTGLQRKNYKSDYLIEILTKTLKSKDKTIDFVQSTLRSAITLYKEGGGVTPSYRDQYFRMHFDNRRSIIVPESYEGITDVSGILLDSKPLKDRSECKLLRYVGKIHKASVYHKNTSKTTGNKYRSYEELAIRSFLKGLFSKEFNLDVKEFRGYNDIIDFIKGYNKNYKITASSLSNLKTRKGMIKAVPIREETVKFVEYVKKRFSSFNTDNFYL
jgi:hypothetical protein